LDRGEEVIWSAAAMPPLYRFHNFCDGIRRARLNFAEAFSQAMISVSSTMASSS